MLGSSSPLSSLAEKMGEYEGAFYDLFLLVVAKQLKATQRYGMVVGRTHSLWNSFFILVVCYAQ